LGLSCPSRWLQSAGGGALILAAFRIWAFALALFVFRAQRPAEESVTASDGRPRRQPIPERDPLVATTHQLDLRPVPPNVRCHSAWYFRSRRHSISVGMPLQASENINKMIGVDATSKSVRV